MLNPNNCPNCGGTVKHGVCEYCGTHFETTQPMPTPPFIEVRCMHPNTTTYSIEYKIPREFLHDMNRAIDVIRNGMARQLAERILQDFDICLEDMFYDPQNMTFTISKDIEVVRYGKN